MALSITLNVRPRGKPAKTLPAQVSLQPMSSTQSLYQEIAKASGYSVHRLRISLGRDGSQAVAKAADSILASAGVADGMDLFVKDLGPQIDWRTVYVIEYIGPLIIHELFYNLRLESPSTSQTLTFYMIMAQFVKREVETLFVHRFSLATMPVRNIFKNSSHYWVLSGLMIAWFVYTPSHSSSVDDSLGLLSYLGLVCFLLGASLNTYIHLIQRSLRPAGTTVRQIPSGPGFAWVTCPNYMFETLSWVGILLVSRSLAVVVFMVVALTQMKLWANKKERRYRREFSGAYVPKKFGIIPGIL
ncbi:synaptic glycoprotein SC2 [Whalleya microplaca]|nr:synaptic glycoprotein SC2 [Whalleya microplaca]